MKINRLLELKCPATIKQFNSGLSENQVKRIEDILRLKIPMQYQNILTICNGVKCNVEGVSFMGSVGC